MSTNNFHVLLTNAGGALQTNAWQGGDKINLTHFQIGSDATEVTATQIEVSKPVTEKTPISELKQKEDDAGVLEMTCIIPPEVGGFMMNSIGLFTDSGILFAVASLPSDYKPVATEGGSKETVITLYMALGSTETVNLNIDPYKVIATQDWVNNSSIPAKHMADFNNPHKVTASQTGAYTKEEIKRIAFHYLNNGTNTTHTTDERLTTWKDLGIHVSATITPKFKKSVFQFSGLALLGITVRNKGGAYSSISLEVNETAVAASAYLVFDTQVEGDIGKMQTTCAIAPVGGWGYKNQTGEPFTVGTRKYIRSPDGWTNLKNKDFFFGKVDVLIIEQEL